MNQPIVRGSNYLCPDCGAPLTDTGKTKTNRVIPTVKRPILACQTCDKIVVGPPSSGAMKGAWVGLVLLPILGVFFILLGMALALSGNRQFDIAVAVVRVGFVLGGLLLIILCPFLLADLLGRARRDAKYWQQYRQASREPSTTAKETTRLPAASPSPEANTTRVADELSKLADLHSQGVLTDEEFAGQKQRLLAD